MVFGGKDGCGVDVGCEVVDRPVVEAEEKEAVGVVVPEAEGVMVAGGMVKGTAVVEVVGAVVVVVRKSLTRKLGRRMRGGCEQRRRMGRWKARVCAVQRPRKKMYCRTSGWVERREGASAVLLSSEEGWSGERSGGAAFSMRAQVR